MAGFTNQAIKNATPGAVLRDDQVPGLHVRVGAKRQSFYLWYRTRGGRARRPKLGDFGVLTIPKAREIAKDMLQDVAAGRDPVDEWKRARGEMTVAELWDEIWAAHYDKPRFHRSGRAKEAKRHWTNHIKPEFANRKLSEVTTGMVRKWHQGKEDSPTAANRALEVLSRMFAFAEDREWRPRGANPCTGIEAFRERKRKRAATPEEISALGQILMREAPDHPRPAAFVYVLMFSGARPRSIERATLDQLTVIKDREGHKYGILTFEGKSTAETGEEEQVLLPPPAMRALEMIPRVEGDNRLIGMNAPRKFWERIRVEAGCPDLHLYDLRRTFATVGMGLGRGMDQIGRLLNHHSTETTAIYARLAQESRVDTATEIAGKIEQLMGSAA